MKEISLKDEKKYNLIDFNFALFFLTVVAMAMGTITIYTVKPEYLTKQLIGVGACIIGMLVMSFIDYHIICKYYMVLYFANLIMLVLVLFIGGGDGVNRWFYISESTTIQPSEFAKIILIVCTAVFLDKHAEDLNSVKTLFRLAVFLAVPIALVAAEPDLSTSVCMMVTLFVVIFVAGLSLKIIGIAALILIPCAGGFLWYIQQDNLYQFLEEYQINRILGFLYGSDYGSSTDQQDNSVMAIGSGQLTGKGLFSSDVATVKDTSLISEQQTDFIFSAIGEEVGFIGSVIVIAIILLIVLQCIKASRRAGDNRGMYIALGVGVLIAFQTFINIGVATAILPNTGLPLPFISYGLSSLVSICAGIGMVINVNLQKKKF